MSKLAIVRRQCKRAMRQLIKRFGYDENSFEIPSEDEVHDVLPGTPIYWTPPSYYGGESDSRLARDEYNHMLMVHETNWDAIARQDAVRWRDEHERGLSRAAALGGTDAE